MTADALIAHFRAVADSSPVPVLLYNLPGPTGIVLTVPIVTTLADHPNVAGMKETSPELERLGQCVTLRNGAFPVFSGWAPVVYPALVAGAAGGILAVANVLPTECVALVEHARDGRHQEALIIQRRITHAGAARVQRAWCARSQTRNGPVRLQGWAGEGPTAATHRSRA